MKKKSLRKLKLSKKQIAKMNPSNVSGGGGTYSYCYSFVVCNQGLHNGEEASPIGNWCWGGYA